MRPASSTSSRHKPLRWMVIFLAGALLCALMMAGSMFTGGENRAAASTSSTQQEPQRERDVSTESQALGPPPISIGANRSHAAHESSQVADVPQVALQVPQRIEGGVSEDRARETTVVLLNNAIELHDHLCEDIVRSGLFTCLDKLFANCATAAACPVKLLQPDQDTTRRAVADVDAHRRASIVEEIAERKQHALERCAEGSAAVARQTTVSFCSVRDSVVAWNRVLLLLTWYCSSGAVDNDDFIQSKIASIREECGEVKRLVGDARRELNQCAPRCLDESPLLLPTDDASTLSDLAHLRSEIKSKLPADVWDTNHSSLLAVAFRSATGKSMHDAVQMFGLSELHIAAYNHRKRLLADDSDPSLVKSLHSIWAPKLSGERRHKVDVDSSHVYGVRPEEFACPTRRYPAVRIAFVGDTSAATAAGRVQRWFDSMCHHCRNASFVVETETFSDPRASLVVEDEHSDAFKTTFTMQRSLQSSADIVVLSLGQRDAVAAVENDRLAETTIAAAAREVIDKYLALPSQPIVALMLPLPVFDPVRGQHTKKHRTAKLVVGPRARRMGEVVIPGLLRAARQSVVNLSNSVSKTESKRLQDPCSSSSGSSMTSLNRRVLLIDSNTQYIRWLERAMRGRMRKDGEAGVLYRDETRRLVSAASNETGDSVAFLHGLHYASPAANYFLMQELPDGVTPRKNSQKFLALTVIDVLLRAQRAET